MPEREETKTRIVEDAPENADAPDIADAPVAKRQESSVRSDHESEWTQRMLERTITALQKQNRHSDAEQISRILVDLSESRLAPAEAETLTSRIANSEQSFEISRPRSQPQIDENGLKNAGILLFIFVVISVVVALNMPQSPRTDPFAKQTVSLSPTGAPSGALTDSVNSSWRTLDVSQEGSIRSLNSNEATTLLLQNTSQRPIDLYWLDFQGQRVKYLTAPPGTTRVQQTYVTHPWLITNADGKPIKLIVSGSQPKRIVIDK